MASQVKSNKRKLGEITNAKQTQQMTKAASSDIKKKKNEKPHPPSHHGPAKERARSVSKGFSPKEGNDKKKARAKSSDNEVLSERNDDIDLQREDQSQVIIGNMFSLYGKALGLIGAAIVEKQPGKIKTVIDEIFSHRDTSEEFVVKTMFLYFLELMGVSDHATLQYNVQYIARNDDEKRLLQLFDDTPDVSFEKMIFFCQDKKSVEQKRLLKRVIKIFVADVVDVLPEKEAYLTAVVRKVCVFSKSLCRLVRYAFTYVGLYLYKHLVGQLRDLVTIQARLEEKSRNERRLGQKEQAAKSEKHVNAIQDAVDIMLACVGVLEKSLLFKRAKDQMMLLSKSVYEFVLQLDDKELQTILGLENGAAFLELVFDALDDEEPQIKKIGLAIITNLFSLREAKTLLEQQLTKHKMQIFKLALPRQKQNDVGMMTRALQLLRHFLKVKPDSLAKEFLQMVRNLVHYPAQSVKEEVGEILLTLSEEFDDSSSLLELQKLHPTKQNYEEFVLNFNEEPLKSQKQLVKLVRVFQRDVQTRSQFVEQLADLAPDLAPAAHEAEEKAALLFLAFHRRTSVLYDAQAMQQLLLKDEVDRETKEVVANLLYLGVKTCHQLKDDQTTNLIFKKMWESATAFLKLSVLNELLQTDRKNLRAQVPLLKLMLVLGKALEKDVDQQADKRLQNDLTKLLQKLFDETEVREAHPETLQIVACSVSNLAHLQKHFPDVGLELKDMAVGMCQALQEQVAPQLFKNGKVHEEALGFVFKLNQLLGQISLKKTTDSDFVKTVSSFVIVTFAQAMADNIAVVKSLTKTQSQILMQTPLLFADQLLRDSVHSTEHLQFQTKMVHQLVSFYLEMFQGLKPEEHLQTVALQGLVDALLLVGGDDHRLGSHGLALGVEEFPRVKETLVQLIQQLSSRIKGSEKLVLEQYQILASLLARDLYCLLSEVGVEFIINFGVSRQPEVLKEVRKLYLGYKQRDSIIPDSKKSIFYSFVQRCVITLFQSADAKVYRLLDLAPGDIQKDLVAQGFEGHNITLQAFSKLQLIQLFLKNFLSSVMLLQLPGKSGANKQQDQFAYYKMVEFLIQYALADKEHHSLLMCVKTLMHKNFLNQKQQEGVVAGLKNFVAQVKQREELSEGEGKAIDLMIGKIEEKTQGPQKKQKPGDKSMDDSSLIQSDKSALDASIESKAQIHPDDDDDDGEEEKEDKALKMKNKAKKSLAEKSGQKRFSKAQIQAMKKDVQSTGVKKQKKMK